MKKHLTTWRIVCYLFYFLGICTFVLGVTNARYITMVTGSGTASAAAVALDTTALTGSDEKTEINLTNIIKGLQPGQIKTVTFGVKNFRDSVVSEVTQEYSIIVNTTGNLPLTYALTGNAEAAEGNGENGTPVTAFSGADSDAIGTVRQWTGGTFPHSRKITHQYTLTITWPEDKKEAFYADEIDLVTLTIDAKQAMPGNG